MNIKKILLFAMFFCGISQISSLFCSDKIEKLVDLKKSEEKSEKKIEAFILEIKRIDFSPLPREIFLERIEKIEIKSLDFLVKNFVKEIEDIMAEYR